MLYLKRIIGILIFLVIITSTTFVCFADDKTVVEFIRDMESVSEEYGCTISGMQTTSENTGIGDVTGRMNIAAPKIDDLGNIIKNGESDVRIVLNEEFDASEYEYINMLIYSPQITTSKLSFGVYCNQGGTLSSNLRYSGGVLVDFSGRKVISMAVSKFSGDVDWSRLKTIRISSNVYDKPLTQYGWMTETYVNIDKIWFSNEKIDFIENDGCYPQKDYERMYACNPSIMLQFNNNLLPMEDDIRLYCEDELVQSNITASVKGRKLFVNINDVLMPNKGYTLKMGKVTDCYLQQASVSYSFKTWDGDLGFGIPYFMRDNEIISVLSQDNEIKALVQVKNFSDEEQNITLGVGGYDEKGNMILLRFSDEEGGNILPGELKTVFVNVENKDAYELKAFVLNSTKASKPVFQFIGAISHEELRECTALPADALNDDSLLEIEVEPRIDDDKINFSGISGCVCEPIFFSVKNIDDEIILIVPIDVQSDGFFSYSGEVSLDKGDYVCEIQNLKSVYKTNIYYISEAEKALIVKGINEATSRNAVMKIIGDNIKAFNMGEQTADNNENNALMVYEDAPYDNFSEVTKKLSEANKILDQMRDCIWSALDEKLTENHTLLLGDSDEYSYYAGLSPKNRLIICESLNESLPIVSLLNFRDNFNEAIKKYKLAQNTSSTGGGTGGAGGGSSGGKTQYKLPTQSNNITQKNENTQSNDKKENAFLDLTDVLWAKDAVEELFSMGCLSEAEDKKFRPNDSVTREEFLKILILAFDINTIDEKAKEFSDVNENDWYFKYINTAISKGLAFGYSDDLFGIGDKLSRQDVCVIIYRLLGSPEIKNSYSEISDIEEASAYARESIEYMAQNGIVQGFEDNSFRPLEVINRAQAAKIIYGAVKSNIWGGKQ